MSEKIILTQFKNLLKKAITLNDPPGNEWSPGILGTLIPMWRANPIKLPLFLPAFIVLGFGMLGVSAVEHVKKNIQRQKEDGIVELAKNLTEDKYEAFKTHLNNNHYNKRLYFHTIGHHLIKNNDTLGIHLLLDNIGFQSENQTTGLEKSNFNHFVSDFFYSLSYNLPLMKELMKDNLLEKFSQKHQHSFEIDVDYYKEVIPTVLASSHRNADSSVQDTISYLNTYPSVWSYAPSASQKHKL